MRRPILLFALAVALGVAGFVHRRAAPAGPVLTEADSLRIVQAYDAQVANQGGSYEPPDWLRAIHLARLRATALRQIAGDTGADAAPAAVDSILDAEGGGTYLRAILADHEGRIRRWPARDRPLALWVAPHPYAGVVRAAFLRWNEANAGIGYAMTDDSTQANVHVTWSESLPVTGELGTTFRLTDEAGRIAIAHVVLLSTASVEGIQNAALHEAGHALGLDHSPDKNDIMAAVSNGRQYQLSDADSRTLRLLYRLPF